MRRSSAELVATLKAYNDFGECVLLDVVWREQGLSLDLVFDYIWAGPDELRSDLDQPKEMTLSFGMVQEFHFTANLSKTMLDEPEEIGWGLNEIACVRIEDASVFVDKYRGSGKSFHHAVIKWESDRRMDIVFAGMEVVERAGQDPADLQ